MKFRLVIVLSGILAGCAGPGAVPEDHYYTLHFDGSGASLAKLHTPTTVHIAPLQAGGIYADRPIVYHTTEKPLELHRYHYHYWSDSPSALLSQGLTECLRAAGVATRAGQRETGGLLVTGRVLGMDRILDGGARYGSIELELGVERSGHGEPVFVKTYSAKVRASGEAMHDTATAFSKAFEGICNDFMGDLNKSVQNPSVAKVP